MSLLNKKNIFMFIFMMAICTIRITIALIEFIKYYSELKKENKEILYFHEKKSFIDYFRISGMCNLITSVIYIEAFICFPVIFPKLLTKLVLVVVGIVDTSYAIYGATEIKHISPEDDLGRKIHKMSNTKTREDAISFYRTIAVIGICSYLLCICEILIADAVASVITIIISIVIVLLGMADVLQHDKYNSEEGNQLYDSFNIFQKLYLDKIAKFLFDRSYYKEHQTVMKRNLKNIWLGLHQ